MASASPYLASTRVISVRRPTLLANCGMDMRSIMSLSQANVQRKAAGGESGRTRAARRGRAPDGQALEVMVTFLGCASSFLGMVIVTNPLVLVALTLSAAAPAGSEIWR